MKSPAAVIMILFYVTLSLSPAKSSAQQKKSLSVDLKTVIKEKKVNVFNRAATATDKGLQLNAREGDGVAWISGVNFSQGEIEADIKGKDLQGQSFVGVAFHGVNDSTYEAVYLRPFNFKASDPGRKSHSIQYISSPDFGWQKLRNESPGKYENSIEPAPGPNEWVHVRIVVLNNNITTFINNNSKPALIVNGLAEHTDGKIGLWVGNGSAGDFANLKITGN